jgi:hypothetical protein
LGVQGGIAVVVGEIKAGHGVRRALCLSVKPIAILGRISAALMVVLTGGSVVRGKVIVARLPWVARWELSLLDVAQSSGRRDLALRTASQ